MFDKAAKFKQDLAATKAAIKAEGRAALGEAFRELFAQLPEFKSISWTQTYPWCDGDTSYFSLNCFTPDFTAEQLSELFNEPVSEREIEDVIQEHFREGVQCFLQNDDRPNSVRLFNIFEVFQRAVLNDEVFEIVFGSAVKITAFPDGTFVVKKHYGDY